MKNKRRSKQCECGGSGKSLYSQLYARRGHNTYSNQHCLSARYIFRAFCTKRPFFSFHSRSFHVCINKIKINYLKHIFIWLQTENEESGQRAHTHSWKTILYPSVANPTDPIWPSASTHLMVWHRTFSHLFPYIFFLEHSYALCILLVLTPDAFAFHSDTIRTFLRSLAPLCVCFFSVFREMQFNE